MTSMEGSLLRKMSGCNRVRVEIGLSSDRILLASGLDGLNFSGPKVGGGTKVGEVLDLVSSKKKIPNFLKSQLNISIKCASET